MKISAITEDILRSMAADVCADKNSNLIFVISNDLLAPLISLMPNECPVTPIVNREQILEGRIAYFENTIPGSVITTLYSKEQPPFTFLFINAPKYKDYITIKSLPKIVESEDCRMILGTYTGPSQWEEIWKAGDKS